MVSSDPKTTSEAIRLRIGEAMVALVLSEGSESLSTESLCERAGVPEAEFDRLFGGLEGAYIWIHERNAKAFEAAVFAAFDSREDWREAMRAAAYAAVRWIEANPGPVRFGITEMFSAGELAQAVRERQLNAMTDLIDTGRSQLADPESKDRGVAIGVWGALYAKLTSVSQVGRGFKTAADYVPEFLYVVFLPYLGQEAAEEELRRGPEDLERYRRGEI